MNKTVLITETPSGDEVWQWTDERGNTCFAVFDAALLNMRLEDIAPLLVPAGPMTTFVQETEPD